MGDVFEFLSTFTILSAADRKRSAKDLSRLPKQILYFGHELRFMRYRKLLLSRDSSSLADVVIKEIS